MSENKRIKTFFGVNYKFGSWFDDWFWYFIVTALWFVILVRSPAFDNLVSDRFDYRSL
jgi:hypothetical protein